MFAACSANTHMPESKRQVAMWQQYIPALKALAYPTNQGSIIVTQYTAGLLYILCAFI